MKVLARAMSVAAVMLTAIPAAHAQSLPSAADVVSKYVTAIGGRDAIMKVKSISQEGTFEMAAAGIKGQMQTFQAAPNSNAMKTTLPGIGEMIQGFDGTVGWAMDPMQGPRLQTDKELDQAREAADFYNQFFFPADQFSKMEVVSKGDYNGEPAYKVSMVSKKGRETIRYFSVASGLIIGQEVTQDSPMGSQKTEMRFSEYEAVDGIKLPKKTEMIMGPNTIVLTVSSTKFNSVPANAFEAPPAIKALINK